MSDEKVTISQRIRRKGEGASISIVLGAFVLIGAVFFFGGVGRSPAKLETGIAASAATGPVPEVAAR